MENITITQLSQFISKCTPDELDQVSNIVKYRRDFDRQKSKNAMFVGCNVSFVHKGVLHEGTITKINNKSVKVKVGLQIWNCSPNLLTLHQA